MGVTNTKVKDPQLKRKGKNRKYDSFNESLAGNTN